jgi:hypothetical protein
LIFTCYKFYSISKSINEDNAIRLLKAGLQIKGADDLKRAAAKLISHHLYTFRKLPEWALIAAPESEFLSAVLEQYRLHQNAAD